MWNKYTNHEKWEENSSSLMYKTRHHNDSWFWVKGSVLDHGEYFGSREMFWVTRAFRIEGSVLNHSESFGSRGVFLDHVECLKSTKRSKYIYI